MEGVGHSGAPGQLPGACCVTHSIAARHPRGFHPQGHPCLRPADLSWPPGPGIGHTFQHHLLCGLRPPLPVSQELPDLFTGTAACLSLQASFPGSQPHDLIPVHCGVGWGDTCPMHAGWWECRPSTVEEVSNCSLSRPIAPKTCPGPKEAQTFGKQADNLQNIHPGIAQVTQIVAAGNGSYLPHFTDGKTETHQTNLPCSSCK